MRGLPTGQVSQDFVPTARARALNEKRDDVSPNSREREYARRRYEKWQAKQAVRVEQRRRLRRNAIAAGLATVLVLGGVAAAIALTGDDDATTAAKPSASASASTAPSASASAAASTDPKNPCPKPPASAGGTPPSYPAPDFGLAQKKSWKLVLTTSCGDVEATLDGAKAPKAVASTIFLSQKKFWDKTPCHRLTTEGIYVLQCGDPTGQGTGGPGYTYGPVENAPADNVYPAGTIAMARQGGNGESMGSQFFLVYKDSTIPSDTAGGYTVLGKITKGLDVVTKVAQGGAQGGSDGAPTRAVSILSTSVSPE